MQLLTNVIIFNEHRHHLRCWTDVVIHTVLTDFSSCLLFCFHGCVFALVNYHAKEVNQISLFKLSGSSEPSFLKTFHVLRKKNKTNSQMRIIYWGHSYGINDGACFQLCEQSVLWVGFCFWRFLQEKLEVTASAVWLIKVTDGVISNGPSFTMFDISQGSSASQSAIMTSWAVVTMFGTSAPLKIILPHQKGT